MRVTKIVKANLSDPTLLHELPPSLYEVVRVEMIPVKRVNNKVLWFY